MAHTQWFPSPVGQGPFKTPGPLAEPEEGHAAPASATGQRGAPPLRRAWQALRGEPLFHFVCIGLAIFAVDHQLALGRDDPRVITLGPEVVAEARQLFVATRGREPTAPESAALRQAWLDNEVLYREGLALQVDRGDNAIRDRVIFKALSVVDANVKPPPTGEAALRTWFESRREKYDEPARFDFQEAVLAGGDASESAVRALTEQLNAGKPGEQQAGLRLFKGRPLSNVVEGYGAEFAKALEAAPPGEWRAYATKDGWRSFRLESTTARKPASFEAYKGVVLQDWIDARMAEKRTEAVRALAAKYTVREGVPQPDRAK
jgi:PPIC-type PPIASE domain